MFRSETPRQLLSIFKHSLLPGTFLEGKVIKVGNTICSLCDFKHGFGLFSERPSESETESGRGVKFTPSPRRGRDHRTLDSRPEREGERERECVCVCVCV